ncbi:general transcription factor II-I repeat domain-containing protein 2A [Trichonephila clavipes]|nr:general transcription factor II-I repeat domain-containing protein 2A [Trichonephila clavipes]
MTGIVVGRGGTCFKTSDPPIESVKKAAQVSRRHCSAANVIARHWKPFQEGEFVKETWLACASSLFEDFDNKDKTIERLEDIPLPRNTLKEIILQLAGNVTDQQQQKKMTLTPLVLYRYV